MSRLDEIEARLKAATPGPWHFVRAGGITTAAIEWIAQVFSRRDEDFPNATANAALIAAAPADIAYLLARVALMSDVLMSVAEDERNQANDMGCDAGNWDGGSADTCDHCKLLRNAAYLERIALESEARQ